MNEQTVRLAMATTYRQMRGLGMSRLDAAITVRQTRGSLPGAQPIADEAIAREWYRAGCPSLTGAVQS